MTNKEKYREFCKEKEVSLYQNDWWLDAVCGNNWDAIFSDHAAFAFPFKKKYGLNLILQPMLTAGLGPVGKAFEFEELEAQLPPFAMADLFLLPDFTAYKWHGFKESTRYTYRLSEIKTPEKVFAGFASSTRQQIRKAEKNITVTISEDIELLYKMVSMTFKRQGKKTPYTLAYVKTINDACVKRGCRKILIAKDESGNVHGACFLAWDKDTAYYVMGGSDPKYRSSAAYSLIMWSAIKEASQHCNAFDFCGSSIASVARFFEGFGAVRVPFLQIKKVRSKALKLAFYIRKN